MTTSVSEYSWDTFLASIENGVATDGARRHASLARARDYESNWVSASDAPVSHMRDFRALCKSGWQGGEQRIAKQAERLTAEVTRTMEQQTLVYDPVGFVVDPAALAAGIPEFSFSFESEYVTGPERPHVHVVMQACASAGIPAETLERRGSCLAALVYALEISGRRVKVTVVASFGPSSGPRQTPLWECRVAVKEYCDDLDPNRIAIALAHPAFFRVGCFALQDSDAPSECWARFTGSRGSVSETTERGDIYLSGAFLGETWDDAWIIDMLEKQGVRFTNR